MPISFSECGESFCTCHADDDRRGHCSIHAKRVGDALQLVLASILEGQSGAGSLRIVTAVKRRLRRGRALFRRLLTPQLLLGPVCR